MKRRSNCGHPKNSTLSH
uniref:Uncharacterized protein n=1 Tax=Rhizophora mucronata TaxID=61149 RepID=A0A2P2NR05_RHIMU